MSYRRPKLRRYILVFQCIWHWDLWVAVPFGIGVYVVWITIGPSPKWEWILPVVTMSVAILGLSWHQWNTLRSRLEDTPYGELVRVADPQETEARMPYIVTIWLAWFSVLWSTMTTILIEDVNAVWAEATLVSVTGVLGMWLILSVASLVVLSMEHDRNTASISSIREELEAEQRRYKTESHRADKINSEES